MTTLRWCRCCRALAADPDEGGGKFCLLCVMHACTRGTPCEVPAETLKLVRSWKSEALPVTPPYTQRRWSADDIASLREHYGLISDAALGRKLGRSVEAVNLQARRLGLRHSDNFYTAIAAGAALGVGCKTVATWIRAGLIHARKAPYKRGSRGRPWQIHFTEIEIFVRKHPARLDPRRMPEGYLREQVRKIVPPDHISRTIRHWEPHEDAYIINSRGHKTQGEMAAYLHRSKEAVHARVALLRAQGRFLPYVKVWRIRAANGTIHGVTWTPGEDAYLLAHWGQERAPGERGWGSRYTAVEIAAHLGRTVGACWSRASRLGCPNIGWRRSASEEAA